MHPLITLRIGKFELDWGENNYFGDHSSLFQESDIKILPYYYTDDKIIMQEGFSRKLSSIKTRLDLLGYSLQSFDKKYRSSLEITPDDYPNLFITFDQICSIITSIDLSIAPYNSIVKERDLGEVVRFYVFNAPQVQPQLSIDFDFEDMDAYPIFEDLDPYFILRLLAENKCNENYFVEWRYADAREYDWIDCDTIFHQLPDTSKILIVTEGSSDTYIIQRAMELLRPDIADFFHFIDMEEHYPFTGTGNLYNFCQGLARIKIQNNVLIIFDNDAAGSEKYKQSYTLPRPKNLHICKLPDHSFFTGFPTIGPHSNSLDDINGSAVAIECFLDLSKIAKSDACVRWTSYNRKLGKYQGEIVGKDTLIKAYKNANLVDGTYDTERLQFLLDYLVDEWIKSGI